MLYILIILGYLFGGLVSNIILCFLDREVLHSSDKLILFISFAFWPVTSILFLIICIVMAVISLKNMAIFDTIYDKYMDFLRYITLNDEKYEPENKEEDIETDTEKDIVISLDEFFDNPREAAKKAELYGRVIARDENGKECVILNSHKIAESKFEEGD